MRVKRYIVDAMPDAMSKIRTELGVDAVILSTKELKVGGFLGMFQKKKIEVIAATEGNETPGPKARPAKPAPPPAPAPVSRRAVPEAYRKTSQLAKPTTPAPAAANTAAALSAVGLQEREEPIITPIAPVTEPPKTVFSVEPETKLPGPSTAAGRFEEAVQRAALQNPLKDHETDGTAKQDKEEILLEEIRQMKLWISKLAQRQGDGRELPPELLGIQQQLTNQEVSTELAEAWLDEIYEAWVSSGKSMSSDELIGRFRECAGSFLQDRIGPGIGKGTRIVYIAGPTGVGKTTTIAKLAADQIFRMRKKVGFITADTYRISAIEQLRTYASILNVPIEVVQSPGDVQRAMQRLEQCDLILMDTAGRNYLNELFVAELHSLLTPSDVSETYLVLSLTSKTQDMKRITEHFSKYDLDKVIFTKLDETESVGPIYNLLNDYPLKVAYLTNGQNVPDDLLQADPKLLIDSLLGVRGL
ncbi:flagellar biosynthesis protein FlhF [Paenibacillus macerans]|uniref:flagellar biosynthesis protein FlhF n=1 Tax=Paenibacillus macerans TaxID=44252 RepID=UPI003D31EDD1